MSDELSSYQTPFKGMKVVDLSGGIAGPYCGVMLGQYGADVIKVEAPRGDWSRLLGRSYSGHTAYSVVGSLGKRNAAIDLKTAEGKEILWRLLRGADVFLEGFPPGAIKRLGFDYEAVRAREPKIIYLSMSGYGQTGPLAARRAMDPILQAYIGITNENRGQFDNHPHRFELSAIDMFAGMSAFQAVSTSLFVREREGKGRYLDYSLLHAAAMMSATRMIASYFDGFIGRSTNVGGVYDTADGQFNLTTVRHEEWEDICHSIEHPELLTDPRFDELEKRKAGRDELIEALRPMFREHTTAALVNRLTARGIMCSEVNTYSDFLKEEHVTQSGIMSWLNMPGFPRQVPVANFPGLPPLESGTRRGYAPLCGEHTTQVLGELGYSEQEIAGLLDRQVVASALK